MRTSSFRHAHSLLLLLVLAVEAIVFYRHVLHDVVPFYPPQFDQLFYYLSTYDLLSAFHDKGAIALLDELLQSTNPAGTAFVLQGALLGLVGGEYRTVFLSINLLYFFALQITLFAVVRSCTERVDVAWAAIALLLSTGTLFETAGGIYDYRIDFSALCLYGMWISLIVWSSAFGHTGRSLLCALVAVLLVYSRFFSIIYIGGLLGLLLVANLLQQINTKASERPAASARSRNILICSGIVATLCLPRLYLARDAIFNYYMIGHVLGEEKYIRARELGLQSLWAHMFYYPQSIIGRHVGLMTWLLAGALAGWSLFLDRTAFSAAPARLRVFRNEFLAIGTAIFIPLSVLTLNTAKSQVVGGIVVVPIVLLMILFGATVWPAGAALRLTARGSIGSATLAMALAVGVFVVKGSAPPRTNMTHEDLNRIAVMARSIANYAAENHMDRLAMSTDRVVDYQNVGTIRLSSIETLRRDLKVEGLLGHGAHGIFATPRDDAMKLLALSDVIVLTDPAIDRSAPYPINTAIKDYWKELWDWTIQNHELRYETVIASVPYRVFVRRPAPSRDSAAVGNGGCFASGRPMVDMRLELSTSAC